LNHITTNLVLRPLRPCCVQLTLARGSATTVGVLLRSWRASGEGGAALLYNWDSRLLEVVFEALDPATMAFSLAAPTARRVGGPLGAGGSSASGASGLPPPPAAPSQLSLRLLLDGRCVLLVFARVAAV
jgi:hypothetical protein